MRAPPFLAAALVLAGCAPPGGPAGAGFAGPRADAPPLELGVRLMKAGEPMMALGSFNRALARDGPTAPALTGVAAALYRLGQRREALRIARSAVDLDPNLAVARNNLGVMLYEEGDLGGALAEFERAFALTDGIDGDIATNLGIAEYIAGRRDDAGEVVDDATFDLVRFGHGVYRLEPREQSAEDPT